MTHLGDTQPFSLSILVLAAGASTRMRGGDKLLEDVAGIALLRHVALVALSAGLPVVVTQAQGRPTRQAALQGLPVETIETSGPMSASLQAGMAAIAPPHAVLVLLADMPEIDRQDLAKMIAAHHLAPEFIHRACDENGTAGHPVIFPAWARAELMALHGDIGAKAVLVANGSRVRTVVLPGLHATTDLDTPEDWARWRGNQTTNDSN